MNIRATIMTLLVATTGLATEREGVIEPKADAALHRMADYVGHLKSFRVETATVDEKVTRDGQKIQELQQSTVTVQRPGQMRVDRVGPAGRATLIDDGKQLGVYNKDKEVYAVAPAPPDLDGAIDVARARLQIDAPAGDLIVGNAYPLLVEGLQTGRYVGLEPIDGKLAHHIAVTKADTDWQLWIKDGPDAVPLRFVITSKDMPGQPQFTVELRDWQRDPAVSAGTFTFAPSSQARRVEFTSVKGKEGSK